MDQAEIPIDIEREGCRISRSPGTCGAANEGGCESFTCIMSDKHAWAAYEKFSNPIVMFQDGTIHTPYPMSEDESMIHRRLTSSAGTEFLRWECSRLVKDWAAMA